MDIVPRMRRAIDAYMDPRWSRDVRDEQAEIERTEEAGDSVSQERIYRLRRLADRGKHRTAVNTLAGVVAVGMAVAIGVGPEEFSSATELYGLMRAGATVGAMGAIAHMMKHVTLYSCMHEAYMSTLPMRDTPVQPALPLKA